MHLKEVRPEILNDGLVVVRPLAKGGDAEVEDQDHMRVMMK
jgi:hypothetical protein